MAERYHFDVVESTNETAKEPQFQNVAHGTIITANAQTSGKGRMGKRFYSPPGQIYMSVLLNLPLAASSTVQLVTVIAAVCVCEAIECLTDKHPQIKWVNDVFLSGRKICGILAESCTSYPDRVIVGIGVNFHVSPESFPEELQGIVGSLFAGSETPPIPKERLIEEIAERLTSKSTKSTNFEAQSEIVGQYKRRLREIPQEAEKFFLDFEDFWR